MPGTRCVNLPMRGSPGRSGASLPTREVLNFGLAHARARDAIHQPFASQQLVAPLAALGLDALTVHSAAPDRHTYLRRPDLGRQLADESRRPRRQRRPPRRPAAGDRRRPLFWAVERQAVPLIRALLPYLQTLGIGRRRWCWRISRGWRWEMILAKP